MDLDKPNDSRYGVPIKAYVNNDVEGVILDPLHKDAYHKPFLPTLKGFGLVLFKKSLPYTIYIYLHVN
jgi:hypothetical protein